MKTAIVTGSSSGIGAAIAEELASKDYNVIVNSASSVEAGEKLASRLAHGFYIQADISVPEDCKRLIDKTIERYGQLDVLINNAAFSSPFIDHKNLDALTDKIFSENFDINVISAWRLARLALPHLQQSTNANIINISSIAGVRPIGSSIAYAVSKAALNHLTKLFAKAMAPDVRVNAIAPGIINTSRVQGPDFESLKQALVEKSLLQRIGEASEIAKAVSYLLECQYVTGQIHTIDGGMVLK